MHSATYDSYQHLITHIVPGPNSVSYFVPLFLLPIALLIPPSILSNTQSSCLSLPLIYASFIHSCLYGGGIDVISANAVLWSTVLIGLQDIRGSYNRIRFDAKPPNASPVVTPKNAAEEASTTDKHGEVTTSVPTPTWEEPFPSSVYQRIPWVFNLLISIRLSGWKIGDAYHDAHQPPPPMTRAAYLRRAALVATSSFLLLDTAAFFARHDAYFHDLDISITTPFPLPSPTAQSSSPLLSSSLPHSPPFLLLRLIPAYCWRCASIAALIYSLITLGGVLSTTPLLLLPTAYSPHTYPMFFGPFSAVLDRGLRGLWGTWWHQTMRYSTSLPGRALSRRLGMKPGGRGDFALRTVSAFGLSGVVHMGLVPPEPLNARLSAGAIRLLIGAFFWCQCVGFAAEVGVADLLRGSKGAGGIRGSAWARVGVLVWVLGFLGATLPLLGWAGKELGYFALYPLPVSLWMGVFGGRIYPWAR